MTDAATTRALWITAPGQVETREAAFDLPRTHLDVHTLFSGISRGTENLVFHGRVPPGEHETMRAPFQEGDFTFPVKYGYCAVGRIQNTERAGELVFSLVPHQSRFAVPEDAVVAVPENTPAQRAVLAANMETALNIVWDARIAPGDTVSIVGCGVIGALTGYIAARIAGVQVCAVDVDPARAELAHSLGFEFATPEQATGDTDVVIHTSATAQGLTTAISLAGIEAKVVEASWFGTTNTDMPLGGRFHQRRLQIVGSQVGRIPPHQAARWTYRRRLEMAMSMLNDPALDALLTGETRFSDLPDHYADILGDPATLCHRVRYVD